MSSVVPEYTPYPYVNETAQLLLENVRVILGGYFYGLYLCGSLASGDFDPGHSDIDFLIVTEEELPETMIPDLELMHKRIWDSGLEWTKKLEGTYIPKNSLYRYNPDDPPRPSINEQKFHVFQQEDYWLINRHILREKGVVIAGPPIHPLIAPVNPDELRCAIINGLIKGWTPKINDGEWLVLPGYQPYIVLTCCRALYTLKYGTVKSKPVSARWAQKAIGNRWRDLIECALAWHYGMPHGDIEKTLQMMKYTLEKAQAYQSRLSGSL
jgi:predicted nucleotidyltransferase